MRKVLRNSSAGASLLLRDMLFDADGTVKPARMSALLNAALGYVAERSDGFVDFDAVPAEGAPLQVRQPGHSSLCSLHAMSREGLGGVGRHEAVVASQHRWRGCMHAEGFLVLLFVARRYK